MKTTCSKCGGFLELNRLGLYRYCNPCHAEHMRLHRSPYKSLSTVEKKKINCRSCSRVQVRRGKLIPKPCEKCGNAKAEMHHEDYNKPLEVTWLCRECHVDLHTERNRSKVLEEVKSNNQVSEMQAPDK